MYIYYYHYIRISFHSVFWASENCFLYLYMPRMGKPFYKVRLPFTTNYTCTVLKVTTWTYCDIYRHTSIGRITQSYNRMACKLLQQETIISDFIYIISICLKHKPRYLVQRIPLIKYNSTIFNRAFCHPSSDS